MPTGLRRSIPCEPRDAVGHTERATDFVGRRWFLRTGAAAIAAAWSTGACSTGHRVETPAKPPRTAPNGARPIEKAGSVEVWSTFDLPATDSRSRELSGAAWDPRARVLWAVQDDRPRIVALVPDAQLRSWQFGDPIEVACGGPVDLEGLVVLPDGFIVCSEDGPRVIELDRRGTFRREIVLPARFKDSLNNRSLEALTMSPSGRYLFTTTEVALKDDGPMPTAQAGTRVRILRLDRSTGGVNEYTYETDPMPYASGEWGVSDLAASSDAELFVLERGWSKGHGNTIRVYETPLDARASCTAIEHLSASSPVLAKTLRVDLASFSPPGLPVPKQPQASPLLDNYEGMTIGPRLPDGRASLVMVSDDNGHADQVARVLVLALSNALPNALSNR